MFALTGTRRAALVAAAAVATAVSAPAYAGQSTGTIGLELNVTNACVVNGASAVQSSFGSAGNVLFADQPAPSPASTASSLVRWGRCRCSVRLARRPH